MLKSIANFGCGLSKKELLSINGKGFLCSDGMHAVIIDECSGEYYCKHNIEPGTITPPPPPMP